MHCCAAVSRGSFHCARCHQTFGTLKIFDRHQDVRYKPPAHFRCRKPEGSGLVQAPNGTWWTPEALESMTDKVRKMHAARGLGPSAPAVGAA